MIKFGLALSNITPLQYFMELSNCADVPKNPIKSKSLMKPPWISAIFNRLKGFCQDIFRR
jgi:hypothetical protein